MKKRQRTNSGAKKAKSPPSLLMSMGPRNHGPEKKNQDVNASITVSAGVATWSTPLLLNPIAQGDTSLTRTGRQVENKSLYVRWVYSLASTSTGGSRLRMAIVYDRQTNAQIPLISEIFQTDNFSSPNNLGYNQRFIVLVDELTDPIAVGSEYSTSGVIYRKLKNALTQFNSSTTGTVADINTGSIYMLVSQSGNLATTAPVFTIYSRIRFTDA